MYFRNSFESVECSEPSSSYGPSWIIVSSVQYPPKTKLFPWPFATQNGIIGNQSTVDSQCSRPFCPSQAFIEMLTFNDPISLRKCWRVGLLEGQWESSFFGIFLIAFYEFIPLSTFQVQIYLPSYFLNMLFGKRQSFSKKHAYPSLRRNPSNGQIGEIWGSKSSKVPDRIMMCNPSSFNSNSN